MKVLLRLEVIGLENINGRGPVVIIINHIAFLDPLMSLCGIAPAGYSDFSNYMVQFGPTRRGRYQSGQGSSFSCSRVLF